MAAASGGAAWESRGRSSFLAQLRRGRGVVKWFDDRLGGLSVSSTSLVCANKKQSAARAAASAVSSTSLVRVNKKPSAARAAAVVVVVE